MGSVVAIERVPLRDAARDVPASVRSMDVVRPARPLPVRVWIVDAKGRDLEVDGVAIAWTTRTVNVRYVDRGGREGFVWVWASAVSRR